MKKKPHGYWDNPENIKKEILDMVEKVGIENFNIPHIKSLKEHSFIVGMARHSHIAYIKYPDLPKLKLMTKQHDFYKNYDNCKNELLRIYTKYKCIPPYVILKSEGCPSLIHQIQKYHGGLKKMSKENGIKVKESNLESYCKNILDMLLPNESYIDNAKKSLLKYDIDLQNKETKQYFEVDRFYISQRVAIEIQGQQHYMNGGYGTIWTEKRTKRIQEIDKIKRKLLEKYDVLIIEIPYNLANEEYIKKILKESNRFKIN